MKKIVEVQIVVNNEPCSYFFSDAINAAFFLDAIMQSKLIRKTDVIAISTQSHDMFETIKDVKNLFMKAHMFSQTLINNN